MKTDIEKMAGPVSASPRPQRDPREMRSFVDLFFEGMIDLEQLFVVLSMTAQLLLEELQLPLKIINFRIVYLSGSSVTDIWSLNSSELRCM